MNALNKVPVNIAVQKNTKLDLSCDHVTTMTFMRMQPVYYRHMLKGEHLNFDCLANVRPSPMVVPTYGRIRCNLRGFFVPYHCVFPKWNDFMSDVISSNYGNSSLITYPPVVSVQTIVQFFKQSICSTAGTSTNYDFCVGANDYIVLTDYGRFCYKILYSLGYDIVGLKGSKNFMWNALGLLAYAKCYCDWYANQNYLDSAEFLSIEQAISYNDPTSQLSVSVSLLTNIFQFISYVCYDSNGYFESCFDKPVVPNASQYTPITWYDQSSDSNNVSIAAETSSGTPYMKQASASVTSVGTQYLHDMLSKITAYQRRHAVAGARSVDRLLAQYGFQTDSLLMNRSIYVGSQSIDVGIGDIYATANGTASGETSVVGDYAGRGFGAGKKSWDFKADEEGIFIVIASILPSGGYYQGYDRNNRHLTKTEFYVPEFDGTVDAIQKGEVFVSRNVDTWITTDLDQYKDAFGFDGRYGEYKRPINRVSGDIAFPSVIAGGNSWHLMRDLATTWNDITTATHSQSFTRGFDYNLYNRIFSYTKGDVEPFYCFFHFDVGAYAPCKPLFDMFDFEDVDNTKKIDMNQGAKVN